MSLIMIGTIQHKKNTIGIRLYDTVGGSYKDIPVESIKSVLSKGVSIDNLGLTGGELVGTNGTLARYPVIVNNKLVGKSPLIVLNEVGDEGYDVVDWKGMKARFKSGDVVKYSESNGISNGKIVAKDGIKYVSSISGGYTRVEIPTPTKKKEDIQTVPSPSSVPDTDTNVNKNYKKDGGSPIANNVQQVAEGGNTLVTDESGLRDPIVDINKPYFEGNKLMDEKTGMTVEQKIARAVLSLKNIDRFLYALYITLHKIPVREDDIIKTMAVSTDTIYYNCVFVRDLEMAEIVFILGHEMYHIAMRHSSRRGDRIHKIWNIACDYYINKVVCEEYGLEPGDGAVVHPDDTLQVGIKFAEGGLYSDKTNINTETAESIYDLLMSQYNKIKKLMEDGEKRKGSDTANNGSGGNGGQGSDLIIADMIYHGEKVGTVVEGDMVMTKEDAETSDDMRASKEASVLGRALSQAKRMGGHSESAIERIVIDGLAPKVKWKSLLRSYLIKATQKESTFSAPDKRFISRGLILPGPKAMQNDSLRGVKVCIDTSASRSDEELGEAIAQVLQLLRVYKAEAEMIYWDTDVRTVAPFKDKNELLKIRPKGGGGTDVSCVFRYFDSKDCRVKPSVILVFTDGQFSPPDATKWGRKYKDTIWIITGVNDSFKKQWGKVATFNVNG